MYAIYLLVVWVLQLIFDAAIGLRCYNLVFDVKIFSNIKPTAIYTRTKKSSRFFHLCAVTLNHENTTCRIFYCGRQCIWLQHYYALLIFYEFYQHLVLRNPVS